ncbi:MAG: hypothetical protein ACK5OX_08760 [Desertimonas sp.]
MSEEAKKYRLRMKAEAERANTAERDRDDLRVELAFMRTAVGRVDDLDAAWRLVDLGDVTVADDGTVQGLDEALTHAIDRYPYLVPADDQPTERFTPEPTVPSGPPGNPLRTGTTPVNRRILAQRFPALRGRRG